MTKPFKVEISEESIQNIYSKVKNYQWHEMPDDGGWDYGTNLDYMKEFADYWVCLLYTSPSPRDRTRSRMPSSA